MRNGCCVGAYGLANGENFRLLTANGDKLPENIEYKVGDVWEIDYERRPDITKPHVEDVLVRSKAFLRQQANLASFLMRTVSIWKGDPHSIFQGMISFPYGQSGYVESKRGLPSQSVGFWLPDKDFEFTILSDRHHYFYFGDEEICVFPYVGYSPVVETISKGTLIRVSLARWWSPNPTIYARRCYCQISGWYES